MAISNLTRVAPSSVIPSLVLPVFQEVPFKTLFPEGQNFGDPADTFLYLPTLTQVQPMTSVGSRWKMADPVKVSNGQLSFPIYTISTRREHSIDEDMAFSKLVPSASLIDVEDTLMRMSTYQRLHYGALFGFSSSDNQGLVTTCRQIPLPADSATKTTITTYDTAELAQFLLSAIRDIQNATFGMAKPVVVTSSTRIINYLMSSIVSLEKSQQKGGGIDSIGGLVNRVTMDWLGAGQVTFIKDDMLKGAAAGGADYINIIAPGLSAQEYNETYSQDWGSSLSQYQANTILNETMPFTIKPNPDRDEFSSANGKMKVTAGGLVRYDAGVTITAGY